MSLWGTKISVCYKFSLQTSTHFLFLYSTILRTTVVLGTSIEGFVPNIFVVILKLLHGGEGGLFDLVHLIL